MAKTSKSALDLELAKFQKLLDDKTLSEAQFQELGALAAKNPVNARAHLLCGRGYDLLGLPDEAVQEYKLADQYGPCLLYTSNRPSDAWPEKI